ncbi:hypothetical protein MKX01_006828, partial [Papaver californicum]
SIPFSSTTTISQQNISNSLTKSKLLIGVGAGPLQFQRRRVKYFNGIITKLCYSVVLICVSQIRSY